MKVEILVTINPASETECKDDATECEYFAIAGFDPENMSSYCQLFGSGLDVTERCAACLNAERRAKEAGHAND